MKQIKNKEEIIKRLLESPVHVDSIMIFDRRVFYPMYYGKKFNIQFNKEKREFYIEK